MTNPHPPDAPRLLSTGIEGLDDILHGGLAQGGLYAVEGDTAAGKMEKASI
jgi:KaiC/GvpD/RAD55 family RecA-like ATPase